MIQQNVTIKQNAKTNVWIFCPVFMSSRNSISFARFGQTIRRMTLLKWGWDAFLLRPHKIKSVKFDFNKAGTSFGAYKMSDAEALLKRGESSEPPQGEREPSRSLRRVR
jgi:hypothetical protein